MEQTPNLSSPASTSSKDVSSGLKLLKYLSESPTMPNIPPLASLSSGDTLSLRVSSPSPCGPCSPSRQSLDSSSTIKSVNCHLLTPDDPFTPLVKVQKQESLICSNPFPSAIDVSFDIDMSESNLQKIMSSMFDGGDDDDDISISGMELAYPEEFHTI